MANVKRSVVKKLTFAVFVGRLKLMIRVFGEFRTWLLIFVLGIVSFAGHAVLQGVWVEVLDWALIFVFVVWLRETCFYRFALPANEELSLFESD